MKNMNYTNITNAYENNLWNVMQKAKKMNQSNITKRKIKSKIRRRINRNINKDINKNRIENKSVKKIVKLRTKDRAIDSKKVSTNDINRGMLLGNVIKYQPEVVVDLIDNGMYCVGCHIAKNETIEQAAQQDNLNLNRLMYDIYKKVNLIGR